jgi:hypothetical protein
MGRTQRCDRRSSCEAARAQSRDAPERHRQARTDAGSGSACGASCGVAARADRLGRPQPEAGKPALTPAGPGVAFAHGSTNPTHDARQHARERHPLVGRHMLDLPPPGDRKRRPMARSHPGAGIRPAHGVHMLRDGRRRRAAQLARAEAAGEHYGDAINQQSGGACDVAHTFAASPRVHLKIARGVGRCS